MKRSTGLRNYMLATGSFKQAIEGSVLSIYAGPVPPTADAPITGATLLCTISAGGTGVGAIEVGFAAHVRGRHAGAGGQQAGQQGNQDQT